MNNPKVERSDEHSFVGQQVLAKAVNNIIAHEKKTVINDSPRSKIYKALIPFDFDSRARSLSRVVALFPQASRSLPAVIPQTLERPVFNGLSRPSNRPKLYEFPFPTSKICSHGPKFIKDKNLFDCRAESVAESV